MIYFVTMSVFHGDRHIAHCVSSDLHYGKGVAKQVKERFGQMEVVGAQDCRIGSVAVSGSHRRLIFHLFTKDKYFLKPTLGSLERCLWKLRFQMEVLHAHEVQIPHLGCGLDRLKWADVLPLIEKVFNSSSADVFVCTL